MPLTREQSIELGFTIEERRRALLAEIRDDLARSREDGAADAGEPAGDAGDESVADLIATLDHADLSRDVGELRAIEAARGRLKEGHYGECMQCGRDIDYARLRANPSAVRCIDCQRLHEKTFGTPGGSTL